MWFGGQSNALFVSAFHFATQADGVYDPELGRQYATVCCPTGVVGVGVACALEFSATTNNSTSTLEKTNTVFNFFIVEKTPFDFLFT